MLISFVLRLLPPVLSRGGFAGEVEHVASGERGQFRDADELRAWCAQYASHVALPSASAAGLQVPSRSNTSAVPGDAP